MSEWMSAEEIKQVILRETDELPQFEEDEYVLFWRFSGIDGNAICVILSEIPNPTHIHIKRDKRGLSLPQIEVGFRLKEVKI